MQHSFIQKNIKLVLIFSGLLLLSSCATHSVGDIIDPPGFFTGLLHGFLILFNFIISLFTDYEIYNFPNSGGWYNFGFLLGVMMFFGGGGAGSCKKKK